MNQPTTNGKILEFQKRLEKAFKQCAELRRFLETWDLNSITTSLTQADSHLSHIFDDWQEQKSLIDTLVHDIKSSLSSKDYSLGLEIEIRKKGIPVQGEYPSYSLPPFKLDVDIQEGVVQLVFGRKRFRTSILSPRFLAEWIDVQYQKVTGNVFRSERFCRQLRAAYVVANQLAFGDPGVKWGRAVSLHQVYELLTLRQTTKSEYPIEVFLYECARLKEQFAPTYEGQRFEFGFSREFHRQLVVVDSKGQEQGISSLTIYPKDATND